MEEAKQETSNEMMKHTFTEDEKRELAEEMARSVTNGADLEGQLSAIKKDFQGRIETEKNKVGDCARKIQTGFEMRFVMCDVVRDFDAKMIRFKSQETGETIRERPMTHADLQRKIFEGQDAA